MPTIPIFLADVTPSYPHTESPAEKAERKQLQEQLAKWEAERKLTEQKAVDETATGTEEPVPAPEPPPSPNLPIYIAVFALVAIVAVVFISLKVRRGASAGSGPDSKPG